MKSLSTPSEEARTIPYSECGFSIGTQRSARINNPSKEALENYEKRVPIRAVLKGYANASEVQAALNKET